MARLRVTATAEVLHLEGEIDLASADQLTQALRRWIESGNTCVDVSGVTFLDSTGLHVILSSGNELNGSGPLVLLRPSSAVRRILEIALPGGVPSLVVSCG